MSLINTTVWATVSMSTVEATPVWQEQLQKNNGIIPKAQYNGTIKAALIMLGMPHDGSYSVDREVNIRSNNDRRVVYAKTTLFTFPVRSDCPFKRIYETRDILHVGDEQFTGWGSSHIKMEDFGNEHDPSRDGDDSDI